MERFNLESINKARLEKARASSVSNNSVTSKKTSPKKITPSQAKELYKKMRPRLSLIGSIDPFTDWLFGIALSLALLKDILDWSLLGSLPLIGTLITFLVSVSIAFIMLITGSRGKSKVAKSLIKRFLVLISGTFVEMIVFGINFLPIESIVVMIVFYMTLVERAHGEALEKETERINTSIAYADDYNNELREAA